MPADRLPSVPDVSDFDPEAKARLNTGPDVKGLVEAVQRTQVEAVLGDKRPPMVPDQGVDAMMKARAERGKSDRLSSQEESQHWRKNSDLEPL